MIGVFDSGVGGLSVLAGIRRELPEADLLYLADRARAPYGPRSLSQIQEFSLEIAGWLIDHGCRTLVVACNTASAAALDRLRAEHPGMPIVGMEPAVKPAAVTTHTGVIAVFATAATFQGRLFESVVSRFGDGVRVVTAACPDWVDSVEAGRVTGPDVEEMVRETVTTATAAGADTLVLGCTHFSFLRPVLERIAGPGVRIIDPAPAVAAQTARVAVDAGGSSAMSFAVSGDPAEFRILAASLAGITPEHTMSFP